MSAAKRRKASASATTQQASTAPTWRTMPVAVGRLHDPASANPNVMSDEDMDRLTTNMREKGCLQPILARGEIPPPAPVDPLHPTEAELVAESTWLLADKPLEIIDGSHRWEAARNAGLARVPVTVIEATDAQAASLRVGMNKIRGELDLATVGRILADLEAQGTSGSDVMLCGYAADEIDDLINAVGAQPDEDDAMAALGSTDPAPPDPPSDAEKVYSLDVKFRSKADRDRAKRVLKDRDADLGMGLLIILAEVGESE